MDGYWREAKMRCFAMKTRLFKQCYAPSVHFSGFNVGDEVGPGPSPVGTAEGTTDSAVPTGLGGLFGGDPSVETLGYFRPSLRDEEPQKARLDWKVRTPA